MHAVRVAAFVRSDPATRSRDLGVLAGFGAWLVYTRLYFVLAPLHLTLPACPFLVVTGHPCPFCGGTRSFAYLWRGDLGHAVRTYPLGPLLFAGTVAGLLYAAWAISTRRTLHLRLTARQANLALCGAGVVLAASWAAKLFWLGN